MGGCDDTGSPPVWARRRVAISTCPKSYIRAESHSLVEEFFVRRRLGGIRAGELTAKQAEAFVILENELAAERNDGQRSARQAV